MSNDLVRLRAAVDRVSAAQHPGEFGEAVLDATLALIPGDVTSYNEVPHSSGEVRVLGTPAPAEYDAGIAEAFAAHIEENPLLEHFRRTGDPHALRFSDVLTRRDLERLELYQLCYRHIGVEHQLAVTMGAEDRVIGVTVSRTARDFTDHERDLMEVATGSFRLVHCALIDRVRAQAALAALESLAPGAGIVMLEPDGRICAATPAARTLLDGLAGGGGSALPEPLATWAVNQRLAAGRSASLAPLAHTSTALPFSAQYLPGAPGDPHVIVLRALLTAPDLGALRELGLTPRQAEVLALLARGLTNRQIAEELVISPHTVDHHVERIFARLGVSSRVEALRVALTHAPGSTR